MAPDTSWICCQLGAREHYAVARSMHRRGVLAALVTDAWVAPGSPFAMVPGSTGQRLSERYSPDLSSAAVKSFTAALIANEATWRVRGLSGWPLIIARNRWFQSQAAAALPEIVSQGGVNRVVFAHSYAALTIFQDAKARGFTTVLGQIDPGERHFEIARRISQRWPDFGPPLGAPPPEYFDDWREECRLADRIVANSEWSREMLISAGVEQGKIEVVGLPFESELAQESFVRQYPPAFSAGRPLRLLFVGSVATFNGVPSLLESLDLLRDVPVELRMVGPMASTVPAQYLA
ncbi:MAG TPA: hypothetical protein VK955_09540, partial [Xanthobacteraceae bacterium]|nr:hypothetical protein [Xanthobacteraceae bacterium]